MIGGAVYLFNLGKFHKYQEGENLYLYITIVILLAMFISAFIVSTIFLMGIYLNSFKKYKYLPYTSVLKDRKELLLKHYEDFFLKEESKKPKKRARTWANKAFEEDLINYYIEYSNHNQKVNDNRITILYRSRTYLVMSLLCLIFIGFLIAIK